jgi:shikimate kinase
MSPSPFTGAVLVGFMGAGKSTVGREAASRLGVPFLDLDASVEEQAGMSVAEIFSSRGEEAFREMERETVRRAVAVPGRVIAAGGGAFADPVSAPLLLSYGPVVWLRVLPETVLARLEGDRCRPLLSGEDREGRVRELMESRRAAYGRAHLVVDCDGRTPVEVAEEVVRRVRAFRREP